MKIHSCSCKLPDKGYIPCTPHSVTGPRGTGKTMNLLRLAAENKATVVCEDPEAMIKRCYQYGLTGLKFITYKQFIDGEYQGRVVIDEVEMLLRVMSQGRAVAFTAVGR